MSELRIPALHLADGTPNGAGDMADVHEDLRRLEQKIDHIDEMIRGNGRPGIKQRIDLLEAAYNGRRKIEVMIIGAFVAGVASFVFQVARMVFKTN